MKAPRETALVKAALQLLHARGILAWRNNTGATRIGKHLVRFGAVGSPDILGCLPGGRLLACEVKLPGREPTVAQAAFLTAIAAAGGLALVLTDLRQLDTLLDGLEVNP
jgi:hypothetical protein